MRFLQLFAEFQSSQARHGSVCNQELNLLSHRRKMLQGSFSVYRRDYPVAERLEAEFYYFADRNIILRQEDSFQS